MNPSGVLLFVAFALIVFVVVRFIDGRRRKLVAAWAATRRLAFDPRPAGGFEDRYPSFGCLRRGHSRSASNVAEGDAGGRHLIAFDYRYVTGHGKNRQTHHFSAIILRSSIPLRPLAIRPEGLFDKVTEFFGIDDIDFESAEFSRTFHVKSPDRRWAYDVIHQQMMSFLLSMPRFSIEFDEEHVIVWRNRRFTPEIFNDAVSVAEGMLDRLPRYVAADYEQRYVAADHEQRYVAADHEQREGFA